MTRKISGANSVVRPFYKMQRFFKHHPKLDKLVGGVLITGIIGMFYVLYYFLKSVGVF